MRKKFITRTAAVVLMTMLLNNCATNPESCKLGQNTVGTGLLIGAGVGAVAGGIAAAAGRQNSGAAVAIVLGAALIGGIAGAIIANERDKACHQIALQRALDMAMAQNAELQQQQEAARQAAQAKPKKTVKSTGPTQQPVYTTIAWANTMTNHTGAITPIADASDTASNQVCMSYSDAQIVDGQTKTVMGKACRGPNGDWQPI